MVEAESVAAAAAGVSSFSSPEAVHWFVDWLPAIKAMLPEHMWPLEVPNTSIIIVLDVLDF